MAESSKESTMRRKAGAGRAPPEIRRVDTTRALRAALAQGAEDALELTANAIKVTEGHSAIAAFTESLPESSLLTLCEGPQDQFGLVVLDPQSLAALIEVQTTGRVVPSPAKPRAPTRTDALMANSFIDHVLKAFELGAAEAELEIAPDITGYRYAMPMSDVRAVNMTMPDVPYRVFELDIDFSEGAKTGKMLILLPLQAAPATSGESNSNWQDELSEVVDCAQVEMEAILARREIPLSEVTNFQVGTIISLPREVVSRIKLEDINGVAITMGRLGQANGNRAICISKPCNLIVTDEPDFAGGNMDQSTIAGVDLSAGAGAIGDLGTRPIPEKPDMGSMADLGSDLPNMSDLADIGELADLPDLGNLGGGGDLPDLGEMGDLPDLGGFGGGSGLPDLPDMPDLPDLESV